MSVFLRYSPKMDDVVDEWTNNASCGLPWGVSIKIHNSKQGSDDREDWWTLTVAEMEDDELMHMQLRNWKKTEMNCKLHFGFSVVFHLITNKLCAWRHDMPRPSPPPCAPKRLARRRAILSHAEYVPTLTVAAALRVKAALSKAAWWLCPFDLESLVRVTCDGGLSVPILVFLGLSVLDLGPMYTTDRQTDRRETDDIQKRCLMPPPVRGGA